MRPFTESWTKSHIHSIGSHGGLYGSICWMDSPTGYKVVQEAYIGLHHNFPREVIGDQ